MTYIQIGGQTYPAQISGTVRDKSWDGRESKAITLSMTYAQAAALFVDGCSWSIIQDVYDEQGQSAQEVYDNSDYCVAGDLTDHRDGTVTAKMGKQSDAERLNAAVTTQEADDAYWTGVNEA